MNRLEQLSQAYLVSLGLGEVVFEPEGDSRFPDFSVGGRIAVEATRLTRPLGATSLETIQRPTIQSLENAVRRIVYPQNSTTRFISLDCRFPMDVRRSSRALKGYLEVLLANQQFEVDNFEITKELAIDVVIGDFVHGKPYEVGWITSPEFSGWVVSDLIDQCRFALERKAKKIGNALDVYFEAWLCVGSHLTNGINEYSFRDFKEAFSVKTEFSRLILINDANPVLSKFIRLD